MTRRGKNRDERGASAVEYGLKIALVAAVIAAALSALTVSLNGFFNNCVEPGISQGYIDESAGQSCG